MLKENYKKIAIGESVVSLDATRYNCIDRGVLVAGEVYKFKKEERVKIPLNINFNPKIFIVTFDSVRFSNGDYPTMNDKVTLNSEVHYVHNDSDLLNNELTTNCTLNYYQMPSMFIEEFNKDEAYVNLYYWKGCFDNNYTLKIRGCRWIAIE